MKKYLPLVCLSLLSLTLACSDDIDDRIAKNKLRPPAPSPTPTPEQGIPILSFVDSQSTPLGGSQRGDKADDLLENQHFDKRVTLTFEGENVTVSSLTGITVHKENAHISLSSEASGVEFVLSGSSPNGSLELRSTHPYQLTLDNLSLSAEGKPAITLEGDSKAFVYLPQGSLSELSDTENYQSHSVAEPLGTLCSKGDVVFSGAGSLSLKGANRHGIATEGYVRIREGQLSVEVSKRDGICCKKAFLGDGGTVEISTQRGEGSAIEVKEGYAIINGGKYTLKAKENGLATSRSSLSTPAYITINGGELSISAWAKGIVTPDVLTLSNARITLNSIDTGVTGLKAIYINSGYYSLQATTGSSLQSNENITFTAGRTLLRSGATPKTPIDVPETGTFEVKAGTLIALGGTPEQKASLKAGSQPTLSLTTEIQANTLFHIREGIREIITFLPSISFTHFILSSSKISTGKRYDLYKGGETLQATQEEGLYTTGRYKEGVLSGHFTVE